MNVVMSDPDETSSDPVTRPHDDPRALVYFEGGRHTAEGMPVDTLRELETFQRLLIEVAKDQWREEHPDHNRVPGSIEESLQLRLSEVCDDSSVPMLVADDAFLDPGNLLGRARDGLVELLSRVVDTGRFPENLHPEIGKYLKRLGATLPSAEWLVVSSANRTRRLTYRRANRKMAVEAESAAASMPHEGAVMGQVVRLDPSRGSFELRVLSGEVIKGHYVDERIAERLRPHLGPIADATAVVVLQAGYSHNLTGGPAKILDVTHVDFLMDGDAPWASRLKELARLEPGWLDGGGKAISPRALRHAAKLITKLQTATKLNAMIFPTVEGDVQLEFPGETSNLEILVASSGPIEVYFLDVKDDREVDEEFTTLDEAADFLRRWFHE